MLRQGAALEASGMHSSLCQEEDFLLPRAFLSPHCALLLCMLKIYAICIGEAYMPLATEAAAS